MRSISSPTATRARTPPRTLTPTTTTSAGPRTGTMRSRGWRCVPVSFPFWSLSLLSLFFSLSPLFPEAMLVEVHPLNARLGMLRVFIGGRPGVRGPGYCEYTHWGALSAHTGVLRVLEGGACIPGTVSTHPSAEGGRGPVVLGVLTLVPFVGIAGARIGRLFSACEFALLIGSSARLSGRFFAYLLAWSLRCCVVSPLLCFACVLACLLACLLACFAFSCVCLVRVFACLCVRLLVCLFASCRVSAQPSPFVCLFGCVFFGFVWCGWFRLLARLRRPSLPGR
jgi:hypothetical protein